jgi:hypothetical protein
MADIGTPKNFLVSPTKEIEDMWIDVQIQEKRSRIARHHQDIEDIKKGKLTELAAIIKMLEMEVKMLIDKKVTDVNVQ